MEQTIIDQILSLLPFPGSNNRELAINLMRSQGLQKEVVDRIFPPSDFVWVEGGHFEMGSEDGEENEKPVHTVTLSSFYIQNALVTQLQYLLVTGKNPSRFQHSNHCPVETVSWYDAIEFCNCLSEMAGLEPVYIIDKDHKDPHNTNEEDELKWTVTCNWSANGYRLPTEAEWEYAAKGGAKSEGYTYAGSNVLDEVAWGGENANGETHPVKQKKPNELGLYDMNGNLWEWCWDWYDEYRSNAVTNPKGADAGSYRVIRGGCWDGYDMRYWRLVSRFRFLPFIANDFYGLRLVVRPSVL